MSSGSYLEQTQLPPAEYLDLLITRAPDLYRRGRVVDHRHTIATLWSLPEPIRLELFTNHSHLLPAPLDRAAADPLAFAETVGAVLDYSLARRTDTGLVLHRLDQAVIRQSSPAQPEHGPHPLAVVLSMLRADLPTRSTPRRRTGHVGSSY